MGLLDRLLNRKKPAENQPKAPVRANRLPAEPERISAKQGDTAGEVSARTEVEKVVEETNTKAETTVTVTAPQETTTAGSEAAQAVAATPTSSTFDPALQKQLDNYFARLRAVYPDGVITRLNTGHKKLAERGAALRKRTGQEGDLDAFFALGGFTYRRSTGGRPPLSLSEDLSSLENKLKTYFPEGIPTVMAIRDTDHRLYLDLRALARREDRTIGEYLDAHGLR